MGKGMGTTPFLIHNATLLVIVAAPQPLSPAVTAGAIPHNLSSFLYLCCIPNKNAGEGSARLATLHK